MARPIITLTTDYGTNDHLVGVMKGVILSINPEVNIVDITHSVLPHDLLDGAMAIGQAYKYFPPKTVHVVVVDPGVGTARRPILVASDTHYFVAPDNGVLSSRVRPDRGALRLEHHFRALFPAAGEQHVSRAGHFCAGGGVADEIVAVVGVRRADRRISRGLRCRGRRRTGNMIKGVVLKVDQFGNLITNLRAEDVPAFTAEGGKFTIKAGNATMTQAGSYVCEWG